MAVAIRLKREGAKNHPYYKIVVADQRRPRDGKFIEIIGTYDPKKEGENFAIELDRANYWVGVGARPSQTVGSIINKARKKAEAVA
ncbi:MAG: 30S ribosomal protein S16 [Terrimicrobiaceae bacterium]|nr:30S ribosomal protein S16 [Terrimicrobiaceae bacterium]